MLVAATSEAVASVRQVALTSKIRAGSHVSLKVTVTPSVRCTISVIYNTTTESRSLRDEGLVPKLERVRRQPAKQAVSHRMGHQSCDEPLLAKRGTLPCAEACLETLPRLVRFEREYCRECEKRHAPELLVAMGVRLLLDHLDVPSG